MMTRLIRDVSRHTKLGEPKVVKPFANSDVVLKGPWLLSVAVCGHKFQHPSQRSTVVRNCCKGDVAGQWEIAIFGHLGLRNPSTD